MSCLSKVVRSYGTTVFRRTTHCIARSTLNYCCAPSRNRSLEHLGIRVQCYSSRRSSTGKAARSRKLEPEPEPEPVVEPEKDAFFVIRKGDVVGIYKSLIDCQTQVGSSVCDPPVSVYKGYSLPKDTEEYLASCGLKNALYAIRAADLKEEHFGTLLPCPFQDPASAKDEACSKDASKKISEDILGSYNGGALGSLSITDPLKKHVKLDNHDGVQVASSDALSCVLEFDGASKGNPGQAGAAAVLRTDDGNLICKLRKGLGRATNNVAEYHAMILGLKYALEKGYTSIRVQGDSKLVCMQMQGLWKVKSENMSPLYEKANSLKENFLSFQISHVLRESNTEADAQANLAFKLADGEVQEEP